MEALFQMFQKTPEERSGRAESFSDKLNSKYTVYLLFIFALMSTTKLYMNTPINCYCPAEFVSSQVEYVERICWTQDTYKIPQTYRVSSKEFKVSYYQWISILFACQAFLFYLPNPIWKIMSKKSGIAITSITDAAIRCKKCKDFEEEEKCIQYASNIFNTYLQTSCQNHEKFQFGRFFHGNYLTFLYLLVKVLYIVNSIGQMFLLNTFLNHNYGMYGFEFLKRIAAGKSWTTSEIFPLVTICKVTFRALLEAQPHFIHCVLPMNLFYEMMFLVMWFWLVFVAIVTISSFLKWTYYLLCNQKNVDYVTKLLFTSQEFEENTQSKIDEIKMFVREYLRRDGCFVLKILECNAGDWITASFLSGIWQKYKQRNFNETRKSRTSLAVSSDEGIEMDKCNFKNVF